MIFYFEMIFEIVMRAFRDLTAVLKRSDYNYIIYKENFINLSQRKE